MADQLPAPSAYSRAWETKVLDKAYGATLGTAQYVAQHGDGHAVEEALGVVESTLTGMKRATAWRRMMRKARDDLEMRLCRM